MPYPLLKVIVRKVLRKIVLCVILLLLKILPSVTAPLGVDARLFLSDLSLPALTPPPTHFTKKNAVNSSPYQAGGKKKASGSTSVSVREKQIGEA